jgi:hypothetical protein
MLLQHNRAENGMLGIGSAADNESPLGNVGIGGMTGGSQIRGGVISILGMLSLHG